MLFRCWWSFICPFFVQLNLLLYNLCKYNCLKKSNLFYISSSSSASSPLFRHRNINRNCLSTWKQLTCGLGLYRNNVKLIIRPNEPINTNQFNCWNQLKANSSLFLVSFAFQISSFALTFSSASIFTSKSN